MDDENDEDDDDENVYSNDEDESLGNMSLMSEQAEEEMSLNSLHSKNSNRSKNTKNNPLLAQLNRRAPPNDVGYQPEHRQIKTPPIIVANMAPSTAPKPSTMTSPGNDMVLQGQTRKSHKREFRIQI